MKIDICDVCGEVISGKYFLAKIAEIQGPCINWDVAEKFDICESCYKKNFVNKPIIAQKYTVETNGSTQ